MAKAINASDKRITDTTAVDGSTFLSACVLISAISSTFVGAKFAGISIPVVCQVPLIAYMLVKDHANIKIPYKSPVLWFALIVAFSCLTSLLLPYHMLQGFTSGNINLFIEFVVIIIPLIVAYYNLPDGYQRLRWGLVWACRFECIWGISQLLIYSLFSINISAVVLGGVMHLTNTNDWLTTYNAGTATSIRTEMRLTGTTQDGAFFGLFMVMGLVLDKSKLMIVAYLLAAVMGVQRATIVCMAVVLVAFGVRALRSAMVRANLGKASAKTVSAIIVCIVILTGVVIRYQDIIVSRALLTLGRFDISSDDGTLRHLMYIPWVLSVLLTSYPNVFLFGVGLRSSGVLLSDPNGPYYHFLNEYMQGNRTWAIESDIASVFGGCGFVGGFAYIYMFYCFIKGCSTDCRILAIALLFFAAMYDFSSLIIGYLAYSLIMLDMFETDSGKGESHPSKPIRRRL